MICPSCASENDEGADNCIRCGKGLFALTVGSVLTGRYEILDAIGRGGMGMVYKAVDRELDETVAIKVLRSEVADAGDVTRRFRSEIKLARRVSHPNVCRIHEYGKDGHLAYIVMEFIEGVDLKRLIKEKGRVASAEAYDVAIQVADALQAIHNVGIIHRDLKTTNIMRTRGGQLKLMDFGIAKGFEAEGATQVTATGQVIGTPEYMSPEQARAEKVDARTDIYALGIVTFELFTGNVPFRGDTPLATLLKHLQEAPPLEDTRVLPIPPSLRPVLRKALAKDRNQRFASAREMADALRAARNQTVPDADASPTDLLLLSSPVPKPLPVGQTTLMPAPAPTAAGQHETVAETALLGEAGAAVLGTGTPAGARPPTAGRRRTMLAVAAAIAVIALAISRTGMLRLGAQAPLQPVAPTTAPSTLAPPTMDAETLAALRKVKEFEVQLAELKRQQDQAVARAAQDARKQALEEARRNDRTVSPEELRRAEDSGRKAAEEAIRKNEEETRRVQEQKRIEEQRLADARAQEEARRKTEEAARPLAPVSSAAIPAGGTDAGPEDAPVRDALRRYVAAIEAKRLDLLKAVFPACPEKTVRESFQFSKSITVRLQACDVRVDGATAVVKCKRHDDIVTSDGKMVQNDTSAWFVMKKNEKGGWVIDVIR